MKRIHALIFCLAPVFLSQTALALSQLKFSATEYEVNENSDQVVISVERVGDPAGNVGVTIKTGNDSATFGQDYSDEFTVTKSWAPGDMEPFNFIVHIKDDLVFEPRERFRITLSNPTGGAIIMDPNPAYVYINDDDPPLSPMGQIIVTPPASLDVVENAGKIFFTLDRVGGITGLIKVYYNTLNGTALASFDFETQSSYISFADQDRQTHQILSIPILDDNQFESDETFVVEFRWTDGASSAEQISRYTVHIKDNDSRPVDPPSGAKALGPSKNMIDLSKNEQAEINLQLDGSQNVRIQIYDRLGRDVISLINQDLPTGPHTIFWNGHDSDGHLAAAGMYHALINVGGNIRKLPIIVLK